MRCIVTGSAGFVGSHLCEMLAARGHDVQGIDDFSTGRIENLRSRNLKWNVRWELADRLECDWLFHLAARADIVPSIERPAEYHAVNVNGTLKLLEWARRKHIKRFVYAASGSCYGDKAITPTPETAPIDCKYPYALTKHLGEQYVNHYAQVYGLPTVSLRLSNVYGPRQRSSKAYGAMFGVFLAQLAHNKPLTIVGDGTQTRDFTHVKDVCAAMILAAESDITGTFNVGSDHSHSVNRIAGLLDPEGVTVSVPDRPGEPRCTLLDITKFHKATDWYPEVDFGTGVQAMRAELVHYADAPVWTAESIGTATQTWFKHLGAK